MIRRWWTALLWRSARLAARIDRDRGDFLWFK